MMLFGFLSSLGIINLFIVGIKINIELVIIFFLVKGIIILIKVLNGFVFRFSVVFINE